MARRRRRAARRFALVVLALALVAVAAWVLRGRLHLRLPERVTLGTRAGHSAPAWRTLGPGLEFTRVIVRAGGRAVDSIAVVRIDPERNRLRAFSSYDGPDRVFFHTIEEWQRQTGAAVIFTSAQYRAEPLGAPLALMVTDGRIRGRSSPRAAGMLVAEPVDTTLPRARVRDIRYDGRSWQGYTQVVEHWPVLLDRTGAVRADPGDWQANRAVIAEDRLGRILVFVTEGGSFTLAGMGEFLKRSTFDLVTALNLDGGFEAELCVRAPGFSYVTYGQYSSHGPGRELAILGSRRPLPCAIGVFPR